jgi:hypothetical protein
VIFGETSSTRGPLCRFHPITGSVIVDKRLSRRVH